MLICLQRINNERMRIRRGEEEVEMRKMNAGESSSSSGSSSSGVGVGVVVIKRRNRVGEDFNGVLAESMITAFELWMEISLIERG